MSDPCDSRLRRISLPTESRTFGIVAVAVVVLSMGPIGRAQDSSDPGQEVTHSTRQLASSNQSLSIEAPLAEVPVGPAGEDASSPVQADGSSAGDDRAGAAAVTRPRTFLRRMANAPEETLLGGRSTPWYRTGLGALSIVLGLVGLLLFLARRYVPSIRAADGGVLRVVTRTSLKTSTLLDVVPTN